MLVGTDVALDPRGVARRLRGAGQEEELALGDAQHREVALEPAARVEHRRVDHAPGRHVDLVRAQALEHRERVAALEREFRERGLVEDDRVLAARALLVEHPREPRGGAQRRRRRALALRQEVVGALPAQLAAEHRALRGEPVVEGRAAQRAHRRELLARPAHRVVQAQRLDGAVGEVAAVRVERGEAADVDVPQVERRLAVDDPLRDELARAARVRDARRVEAGADEVAGERRRLAEDEVAVAGEALGAVQQHLHLRGLEARRPVHRVRHQRLELVPVLGEELELEALGDRVDVPGLRDRLEAAHHEAAHFLLEVDVAVRVAHDRMVGSDAGDRLGDDVEVLGRVERDVDAREPAERARPLAGAIDDDLALDRGRLAVDDDVEAAHASLARADAGDARALDDARAAHARAASERLREVGRVGLAVARNPDRACQVVGPQDRRDPPGLGGRDELELDAEALRARHLATEELEPLGRLRDVERAARLPAGREAGLLLERRVELDAVAAHARHVARRPVLADEPGGVPGRAARELALLEQHDVAPSELRQVVGGRAAGDAAADDDDAGAGGKGRGHGRAENGNGEMENGAALSGTVPRARCVALRSCDRPSSILHSPLSPSPLRGPHKRNAATPATTATAPAIRRQPKPSFRTSAPMAAANSTDTSRSAATTATGARVIAQSAMP